MCSFHRVDTGIECWPPSQPLHFAIFKMARSGHNEPFNDYWSVFFPLSRSSYPRTSQPACVHRAEVRKMGTIEMCFSLAPKGIANGSGRKSMEQSDKSL